MMMPIVVTAVCSCSILADITLCRGRNGEWVTVKDLVQRDDLPNVDKDIWLSYSLCRLLARRYYGFRCAEEGDDKVRRFALADLGTTGDYKRAFTIVEVQLAFLHDYFFTASLPIIESGSKYIEDAQTLMRALSTIIFSIITSKANIIPTLIASSMYYLRRQCRCWLKIFWPSIGVQYPLHFVKSMISPTATSS